LRVITQDSDFVLIGGPGLPPRKAKPPRRWVALENFFFCWHSVRYLFIMNPEVDGSVCLPFWFDACYKLCHGHPFARLLRRSFVCPVVTQSRDKDCKQRCVFVCPPDISKTNAARIAKLDKQMFHHES